jgi:hypothetical protein
MSVRGMMLLAGLLLLSACAPAAPTEPDRVATRVAEDLAVARTLTAVAQAAVPTTPATAQATPTTATLPPTKALLPTPTLSDPIVPGFGNTNGLTGRIILPGYAGPLDAPVFQDQLVFRLEVFDPEFGTADGAGITSVDFAISDPSGTQHYASTIDQPPYCAFAGGQLCDVYVFAAHDNAWPDGTAICAGSGYQANMIASTTNPARDGAFWGFNFSVAGNYPPCF